LRERFQGSDLRLRAARDRAVLQRAPEGDPESEEQRRAEDGREDPRPPAAPPGRPARETRVGVQRHGS
jgi:hypothetical protein